jgi:hypothetical protein
MVNASFFKVEQNGLLLVLDNTFEHKISNRELLKRQVGLHPDNFLTPFLGVVLIEAIHFYFAQIQLMLPAYKNECLVVKNH